MNPEEHENERPRFSVERCLTISKKEWDEDPGACAVKLGTLAAVVLTAGHLAPFIAIAAGLIVVGRAVRS
jgi:hypothetical protein